MAFILENLCDVPSKRSIKLVLIGDGATGKSSYFDRLSKGDNVDYKFSKNYNATQGCNVCQIEFKIGSENIIIHLFDTAGQEKFGALRDSYIMGANGVILMYDISQKETKTNVLSKWIPEIKRILISTKTKNYVPIMVVGNKNDTKDSLEDPSIENIGIRKASLGGGYDSSFGNISHCFVSVKADENLMEPLNWLLKNILGYFLPINIKKSGNTKI